MHGMRIVRVTSALSRMPVGFLFAMASAIGFAQQQTTAGPQFKPVQQDPYEVYAEVLRSKTISLQESPQKYWLVEETTIETMRPSEACVAKNAFVRTPEERRAEFQSVLEDFAARCHERVLLKAENFHALLPVRLADGATRKRYVSWGIIPGLNHDPARASEFENKVAGLHSFSEVYFNADHTLAMVYHGLWCGGECGYGEWVVLERKDGKWRTLPWGSVTVRS